MTIQLDRRQQMHVEVARASGHQIVPLDKVSYLFISCDANGGQFQQMAQNFITIVKVTTGQFANDEGMNEDLVSFQ